MTLRSNRESGLPDESEPSPPSASQLDDNNHPRADTVRTSLPALVAERTDRTDRLNADDLAAGWAALSRSTPEAHAIIQVGFKTDLGCVRENNEDKFDMLEPEDPGFLASKGRLYGVADGMGGHSAGQIASEMALKTLIQRYYRDPSPHIVDSLRMAIEEANTLIFESAQLVPERQGMGTTLTAAVIRDDRITVAHVGDSRAYLIRAGEIRQLTHDHSLVAEQVRMGAMTAEEALTSPLRNIILRSIGTNSTVAPDIYEERVLPGDIYLLCSDGLTGHLTAAEILEMVGSESAGKRGPSMAAYRLVETANSRGGRDNITVVILSVREIRRVNPDGSVSSVDYIPSEADTTKRLAKQRRSHGRDPEPSM